MPVYLGLDGGGTACRALALNEEGEQIYFAQGGPANLTSTPERTIERSLSRALGQVPNADFCCACFAGLLDEGGRQRAIGMIRDYLPHTKIKIEPDYAAALRACPAGTLAVVIAGTGSIICSRHEGALVKSGGGGYLLGDEGSGFRWGRAALKHFLACPDEASGSLAAQIEKTFRTLQPSEILQRVYTSSAPAPLIASLGDAFFADLDADFPYAARTLAEETDALAETTAVHLRRWHPGSAEPIVGVTGSAWGRKPVRVAFLAALQTRLPHASLVQPAMPPVRGAALLAMEMNQP